MTRSFSLSCLALLALIVFSTVGCGDANPEASAIGEANQTNMQRLANLYFMYQVNHKFQGPADEAEFKKFLAGVDPEMLGPMGVDPNQLDALFISERDNQPFEIRYGVASSPRGSREPVIFEKEGAGGKRMVGFLNMQQREVEADEYSQLLAGKGTAGGPTTTKGGRGDGRSGS